MLYSTRKRSSSTRAWARLQNSCSFRHSSRRRALNDSPKAVCQGLPGAMWNVSVPVASSQSTTSEAMNSPPLSDPHHGGGAMGRKEIGQDGLHGTSRGRVGSVCGQRHPREFVDHGEHLHRAT